MTTPERLSEVASPAAVVNADNPWPGLLPFREADQVYFQGRRSETGELLRLVMRERLVVLFGLSGLGKSSLLQAGLFPQLRRENMFPVYIRLDFTVTKADLIAGVRSAIAAQAAAAAIEAPAPREGETLWEYFHRNGNDFWNDRNRPVLPLLVFDQFEEFFTLGRMDADRVRAREGLLDQLADLAEGRPPAGLKARLDEQPTEAQAFAFTRHHYKILLSIREDFLPDLEALRVRIPALALNRLRLRRMNGEAALLVVNQAPHLVDSDVALKIVRFAGADRRGLPLSEIEVEPALLSVVCRELNTRRQRAGEPKITAGLLEGSKEQVLEHFYERSVSDLPAEVRGFIETRLLTVSGYRDSVALENALSIPGVTSSALNTLVDRRLIRLEDRDGVQRLELTHDLLTAVVRANRERTRLLEAAEEQRAALIVSQKRQRELERSRRLKIVVAASVIAVLILAATAWQAVQAGRDADVQRRNALEAQVQAQAEQKRTQEAIDRIKTGMLIRQAGLSGNLDEVKRLTASLKSAPIEFDARAQNLRYQSAGRDIYKFELFPDPASINASGEEVAFITYLTSHETFQNTLMPAGPDRQFHASYQGWGCLAEVIALVEYKNPEKPPDVAPFNMCEKLGW